MAAPQYMSKVETPMGDYIALKSQNGSKEFKRAVQISRGSGISQAEFIAGVLDAKPDIELAFTNGINTLDKLITSKELEEFTKISTENFYESMSRNIGYTRKPLPKRPDERNHWLKPMIIKAHLHTYVNVGNFLPPKDRSITLEDDILRVDMGYRKDKGGIWIKEYRIISEEEVFNDNYIFPTKLVKVQSLWSEDAQNSDEEEAIVNNETKYTDIFDKPYFDKQSRHRQ